MARSGRDHNPENQLDQAAIQREFARPMEDSTPSQAGREAGRGSHDDQDRSSDSGVRHFNGGLHVRTHYSELERDRICTLRDSEIGTLGEIGTFRAVTLQDLTYHRYGGDADKRQRDINNLGRQGLIRLDTAQPDRHTYVTLTREGHRLIDNHRPPDMNPRQELYNGFVKPREAKHDASLYPLYQQEAQRITREGGTVNRVVLDFELKRSINRKLSTIAPLPETNRADRKQEIAREQGLTVVDGKILLPDLRIEYEDRDHQQTKVDLELATGHYHRDTLAQKARAGFAVFREQSQGGRSAEHDHGLMRDVFSL